MCNIIILVGSSHSVCNAVCSRYVCVILVILWLNVIVILYLAVIEAKVYLIMQIEVLKIVKSNRTGSERYWVPFN